MKALHKNKIVDVVKIITNRSGYVKYPLIVQVKIKFQNGATEYVDGNEIEFYDEDSSNFFQVKYENTICPIHTNTLLDKDENCSKCLENNNK